MAAKVKGVLFKNCVSFRLKGDDRSMSKRLNEVSRIVKSDSKRITKIVVVRTRPLAAEQTYDVRVCGLVGTIEKIRRIVKGNGHAK